MCLHSSLGPAGKQGRAAHLFHFAASTLLHGMLVIRLLLEVLITLDAVYLEAVIIAC